jgi:hypothetical protein
MGETMTVACRVCSRVNPAEARYCYHDGVALDGHTGQRGPIAVGSQPFLSPFVFPSGRACRCFDELVLACDADWNEARDLLRQGYLEGFFGGLGRADLAAAARQAARNNDPDLGLDQFLTKLPSSVREPARLVVQPLELNLGLLTRDSDRHFVVHLENAGHGLLSGSVAAESSAWLSLGEGPGTRQKVFQTRHDASIPVQVIGKGLRASNKPIESNGGTALIFVRAEVRVRPFPEGSILAGAITPRQIAEKAKAAPKEAAPLFVNGAVAAWYESNGWIYPVQGPASSGLGAVQQFFEALGLVHPPKVEITETSLQLHGNPGDVLEHTLQVQAVEKRPVYAHASSTVPWLQVGRARLEGRTARIPLRVPLVPALPGERLRGEVHVVANGNQRFTVEVTLTIANTPPRSGPAAPSRPTAPVVLDYAAIRAQEAPVAILVEPESPGRQSPPPPPPPPPVASLVFEDQASPEPEAILVTPEPPVTVVPVPTVTEEIPELIPVDDGYHAGTPPPLPGPPIVQPLYDDRIVEVEPLPEVGPRRRDRRREEDEDDFGPQRSKTLWHLAALGALLLALFGMALHDLLLPAEDEDDLAAAAAPINWTPRLQINFDDGTHNRLVKDDVPTMRFGLETRNPEDPTQRKWLTFFNERETDRPVGKSNNTCVRLDGQETLFGPSPAYVNRRIPGIQMGDWVPGKRAEPLGKDDTGRQREGLRSTWRYPNGVEVTQIVELVPGEQSRKMDTCLIRYVLENRGADAHAVGIRFLLDTYIGANDGVPFIIPGASGLCDTSQIFPTKDTVPDYIQALENPDLRNPGTVARLQFRLGNGLEAPERVTLGGWPDPDLQNVQPPRLRPPGSERCLGGYTLWDVPVLKMNEFQIKAPFVRIPGKPEKRVTAERDSAVVIYWSDRMLQPGQKREVGFTYGLGEIASSQGKLSLTVGGPMVKGSEFSLTAVVNEPQAGEQLTLTLPKRGLRLVGAAQQPVPPVPAGATRPQSPVTWRLAADRAGLYRVVVKSSTGAVQELSLRIAPKARGMLD